MLRPLCYGRWISPVSGTLRTLALFVLSALSWLLAALNLSAGRLFLARDTTRTFTVPLSANLGRSRPEVSPLDSAG